MSKPLDVKRLRRDLGLTAIQLAAAIRVNLGTVYRWERTGSRPSALALGALQRLEKLGKAHAQAAAGGDRPW